MRWLKARMNPPFGSVQINDHVYFGTEVTIDGDNVFLDGVKQSQVITQRSLRVAVIGDIAELRTVSGHVEVSGEVGNIQTTSGDVSCKTVGKSITTVSGDIDCTIVYGDIQTVSGDIIRK